jgi:hypothetical protein
LCARLGDVQHCGMKYRNTLMALLLALASCGGDGDSSKMPTSSQLGQDSLIGFGETIHVDMLTLEFTTLAEESRCPTSVVCVWEGNARILVTATRGNATAVLELNTSSRFPTSAVFEGYSIQLRKLDPYPATPSTPNPQRYTATVLVDGNLVPAS